jgi:uncharacterized protein YjbJ (UPF0337 family)
MGERLAKAKEVLGYATGDREVEAEGRVDERIADPADPTQEKTPDNVSEEEHEVRQQHGEYRPERIRRR